jgi:transcriptional regulator with XRE-family HTH domain
MPKHKYQPHHQLKAIRKTLQKTQKEFAKMLGVSYPYLLSVETGQRDMSESIARKISWLVGVSSSHLLKNKRAKPMSFDDTAQDIVPFSLETYRKHCAQFPKFTLPGYEEVSPTAEGYTKVFHAVLDSAMNTHQMGELMPRFLQFFADVVQSNIGLRAFLGSLHKLYSEDAEAGEAAAVLLSHAFPPRA